MSVLTMIAYLSFRADMAGAVDLGIADHCPVVLVIADYCPVVIVIADHCPVVLRYW